MSNLCTVPECYAYGQYCRRPGHVKKEDKPAVANRTIAEVSESMKDKMKVYKKKAKAFLTKNYKCQCKGCKNASQEVHHQKGRVGDLLLDERFWLAVCNEHHRKITDDSDFAYKNGYSLSRLEQAETN